MALKKQENEKKKRPPLNLIIIACWWKKNHSQPHWVPLCVDWISTTLIGGLSTVCDITSIQIRKQVLWRRQLHMFCWIVWYLGTILVNRLKSASDMEIWIKVQFGVKNPCYCYPVTNDIMILNDLSTEERLWKPWICFCISRFWSFYFEQLAIYSIIELKFSVRPRLL